MPEGPEAHTIARKLNEKLTGKYILSCNVLAKPEMLHIADLPMPNKVLNIAAHGKRPIMMLQVGFIVTFLAMKGRWSFTPGPGMVVEIVFGSVENIGGIAVEEPLFSIWYNGLGPCGHVKYLPTVDHLKSYFRDFGPDMLSSPPTVEQYINIVKNLVPISMQLSVFLLEQKYVSGVGNYLRSEIMYRCKLRPSIVMGSLSQQDITLLYNKTKEVMIESYQYGGLTMKDYWDPNGVAGVFPIAVYNKTFDGDGYPVIKEKAPDGRYIFWVQQVQV
jgi:endonuclease-8